ncbi:MAG: peptide chain release factor N(5)-glutamine methyltransferase [Sulfobacillus acidophilus]|uniref:Release factor glutamine methyltransferase n=1 Tax=Sulfobacillus acidophilus TaxID=53633 RepID=A0A2T2WEE2_9FIRM|nr:MAG: peptide chain release factor N(5)-glutamine methyltransferase [Sulfobacillus acidophilus]
MQWRQLMQRLVEALRRGQIPEPEREAQYLLQWATGRTYADWIAWGGIVDDGAVHRANVALGRRLAREPLAYITGQREFYGLNLAVSPAVLIPRPETENLVQTVLSVVRPSPMRVVDVGCGCGAIALAVKATRPAWMVYGADVSASALALADQNGRRLGLSVRWIQSDLLVNVPSPLDIIVANLPYVDLAEQSHMSPETRYEPPLALFAEDGGLALIRRLIEMSAGWLRASGWIFLECSPAQAHSVSQTLKSFGFGQVSIAQDYAGLDRVVFGRRT